MANVINMGGGGANVQSKTVKSSQTQQTINPPEGVDGFNPVIVSPFTLQSKTANPSTVQQTIKPDTGVDALSQVFVSAAPLQEKTVVPASTQQIIVPDTDRGYYGLSKVTCQGIPGILGIVTTVNPGRTFTISIFNSVGLTSVEGWAILPNSQELSDESWTLIEWIQNNNLGSAHNGTESKAHWIHTEMGLSGGTVAISGSNLNITLYYDVTDGMQQVYFDPSITYTVIVWGTKR